MGRCDVSSAAGDIAPYLSDEGRQAAGEALSVAWPASLAEVRELVADAASERKRLTVSGGGTGLCGGRVPSGGTVLATDRLPKRLDLLPKSDERPGPTMLVSAGVTLHEIGEAAARARLLYPPDPTEKSACLGGTVATNAAGRRGFRFGATRDWIVSLEVVFADGTGARLRRGEWVARDGTLEIPAGEGSRKVAAPRWAWPATTKCSAGYWSAGPEGEVDLVDLVCGSEGTLAVVVAAEVALVEAPRELASGLYFFESDDRALDFVAAARDAQQVAPWSLELFDAAAVELAAARDEALPKGSAAVFFEEPLSPGREESTVDAWQRLGDSRGAGPASLLAVDPSQARRLDAMRHAVPTALNGLLASRGVPKVASDAAVPRGATSRWLDRARAECAREGLDCVAFGHAGDDHLHVNVLLESLGDLERGREACDRMAARAVEMGGVVAAEHGLGKTKRHLLEVQHGEEVVRQMRQLKGELDPQGLLGQGTLFEPDFR